MFTGLFSGGGGVSAGTKAADAPVNLASTFASKGVKGDKLVGNYYVKFDQEYKKEKYESKGCDKHWFIHTSMCYDILSLSVITLVFVGIALLSSHLVK